MAAQQPQNIQDCIFYLVLQMGTRCSKTRTVLANRLYLLLVSDFDVRKESNIWEVTMTLTGSHFGENLVLYMHQVWSNSHHPSVCRCMSVCIMYYVYAAAASLLTTLMHTDCSINDRMHQPAAPQITDDAVTLKSHL